MNISHALRVLLSIPKTIYFNFRVLPFAKAVKLPFFIAHDIKLGTLKGDISLESAPRTFMVRIGSGGSDGVIAGKGYLSCSKGAAIVFEGKAHFSPGISIRVDRGCARFGERFSANKNCFISCTEGVTFGADTMMGFRVSVRDSDGHQIISNGTARLGLEPVTVGDHVWLCSHTHVLKGCQIPNDCILGYGSIATGTFTQPHCLIAGHPAKVIREDVSWEA